MEKLGVPAVPICTDEFVTTARALAATWGAPEYPVLYMPHPLANLPAEEIRRQAEKLAAQAAALLGGESPERGTR